MSDNHNGQRKRERPCDENNPAGAIGKGPINKSTRSTPLATPTTHPTANLSDVRRAWKTKLDMSPPPKKTNPVNKAACFAEVEKKMGDDGLQEFLVQDDKRATDEQKIVYYLYGIEFCKHLEKEDRVIQVQKFLNEDAKKRMMDFLKKESDMTYSLENVHIWRVVQGVILCYQEQKGAVTIFDEKSMPVALRCQASSNCYQHATGGTVGYKVAFDKDDNENIVYTVDVPKFMRRYYDDNKLMKRILENKGGKSQVLLSKMIENSGLQVGSTIAADDILAGVGFVTRCITKKGPALVSRFCTDEFFKELRGGYVDPKDDSFRIHQFDRVDDKDTHHFLRLGVMSRAAQNTRDTMESKNKKKEGEGNSDSLVPTVSQSRSFDSHAGDTEAVTSGEDLEVAEGLHSMILIGYRKDAANKVWFLIQNTWKTLPIFEASVSFLAHRLEQRNGKLVFMQGTFRDDSSNKLTSQGLCLESTIDDDVAESDESDDEEDDENSDSLEE